MTVLMRLRNYAERKGIHTKPWRLLNCGASLCIHIAAIRRRGQVVRLLWSFPWASAGGSMPEHGTIAMRALG